MAGIGDADGGLGLIHQLHPTATGRRPAGLGTTIDDHIVVQVAGGAVVADLGRPFATQGGQGEIGCVGVVVAHGGVIGLGLEIELEGLRVPARAGHQVAAIRTEGGQRQLPGRRLHGRRQVLRIE